MSSSTEKIEEEVERLEHVLQQHRERLKQDISWVKDKVKTGYKRCVANCEAGCDRQRMIRQEEALHKPRKEFAEKKEHIKDKIRKLQTKSPEPRKKHRLHRDFTNVHDNG